MVSIYNAFQQVAVRHLLWRLVRDEGKDLVQHLYTCEGYQYWFLCCRARLTQRLRREAGETILKIVHEYNIEPHGKDALVEQVGEVMEQFSAAAVTGRWAVDMLPFLKVPDWMPDARVKRTARLWKRKMTDASELPYSFAKDRIDEGRTSFISKSIEQGKQEDYFGSEDGHAIK